MNNISIEGHKINRKATGFLKFIDSSTIALDTVLYKDKFVDQTEKKRKHWALYNNKFETVTFKISDINSLTTTREGFLNVMRVTFVSSLLTALVISPLASIEKGKVNFDKVKKISGISGATAGLSIILSISFGHKHHRLIPTEKRTKIWTIQQ